jgi:hypothetical protein
MYLIEYALDDQSSPVVNVVTDSKNLYGILTTYPGMLYVYLKDIGGNELMSWKKE